jgi:hypothetical protein
MTRRWNPWGVTAVGLVFVMATAVVTGLVVANWPGLGQAPEPMRQAPAATRPWPPTRSVSVKPVAAPIARRVPVAIAVPTEEAVQACNRRAADEAGDPAGTEQVVKDAASVSVAAAGGGTLYGLDESRRNDEKYRAAYSRCMRARGYAAG